MASKMTTPETHPNYRPPVDMPPISLDDTSRKPTREELESCGPCRPFRALGVLSPSECAQLVAAAEGQGPAKVDWEYSPDYRDCSRVVMRSGRLARALYTRLVPLLTDAECESVRPFGFDGGGSWRPLKINDVVRISRYDAAGHFSPHRDGAFVENDDVRSVYTVLVYLNQAPAFDGGSTVIYPSGETDSGSSVTVEPLTGSALIMTHDTLHAGEAVVSGHKYIARFDLMFRRLGGGMTETELARLPERQFAERLYSSSIKKQRAGDPKGSTEDYVRALNIQAKFPSSTPARQYSQDDASRMLGEDCFVLCLRFLGLKDISNSSAVSRSWHALCSSGVLWRELFALRWPALSCAEGIVPEGSGTETPLPVPASMTSGGQGSLHRVFATVLPYRPKLRGDSHSLLKEQLYPNREVPSGYMFSALQLSDFTADDRKFHAWSDFTADAREVRGWKMFHARVQSGSLILSEFDEGAEKRPRWGRSRDKYDASQDTQLDTPPPIPLEASTELSFARKNEESNVVDACIVRLPGTANEEYLVVCSDDPRVKTSDPSWFQGFPGIIDDIARVIVAQQTERALRYGDSAIRCDAKTKQWKSAYARRHVAELFFDAVTIDIGSKTTKFMTKSKIEDVLSDWESWRSEGWIPGQYSSQLLAVCNFFAAAAAKYHPDISLEHRDDRAGTRFLKEVAVKLNAADLIDRALCDPGLAPFVPRAIIEARVSSGSFVSLVQQSYGHLWSAGHGLENHNVGEPCLAEGRRGGESSRAPFTGDRVPDCDVMGIICAYVVEETFARRPKRRSNLFYHRTCAEHPVNIVEPALGFSERVRLQLMRKLASWNVPFVGFVNGAAAALLCGKEPKQNGIVVMLGGVNSAVVQVVDGVAQTSKGVPLVCSQDENPCLIAEEVCTAIQKVQANGGDQMRSLPILMTGGGATNSVVDVVKGHITGVFVASSERERHLDAVRGGNIMVNLSDGRKYFRGVLNLMWSIQLGTDNGRD